MKCETVRDLLPLYSDNLVSENTAKDVKLHLDTCDRCRKIYEDMKLPAEEIKVPEESKAMKKVNGKLKKRKRLAVFLTIVIIGIFGVTGYLTYGEITKKTHCNFSTIFRSIEMKKLATLVAEGDFDTFFKNNYSFDLNNLNTYKYIPKGYQDEIDELKNAYEKAFGDTKLEKIDRIYSVNVGSDVIDNFNIGVWAHTIDSSAVITFENGDTFTLNAGEGKFGNYDMYIYGENLSADGQEFVKCFNNIHQHDIYSNRLLIEKMFERNDKKRKWDIVKEYFTEPEKAKTAFETFFENDYTIINCEVGELKYDEEKEMLYSEFFFEAEDKKGSALMQTRLYKNIHGFILPEKSDIKVYSDNCTEELEKDMENIFE